MRILASLILLIMSLTGALAEAKVPVPTPRFSGLFDYQGNFDIQKVRRTELVPFLTEAGERRLKDLRRAGYTCIRKNAQIHRCAKTWKPETAPEGIAESLQDFMGSVEVEFFAGDSDAELIHDGSSVQQWVVRDQVRLLQSKVHLYRVNRTYEGRISLNFPVGEEQPLGTLNFHSKTRLGLVLVANLKESETVTMTYVLEPYLDKAL